MATTRVTARPGNDKGNCEAHANTEKKIHDIIDDRKAVILEPQ